MSAESKKPHILIVDDEPNVVAALRRCLRREPYRFSTAGSGEEALRIMREDRPDVLISDHLMPQMTGVELLRRVRLLYPDTARVILTGQAELESVVAAINDGEVFRFLRKPWDETELKVTLHMAIEQQRTERENRSLLELLRRQADVIRSLEKTHPGIASIARDDRGAILIDEGDMAGLT